MTDAERNKFIAILSRLGPTSPDGERIAAAEAAYRFMAVRNLSWGDVVLPAGGADAKAPNYHDITTRAAEAAAKAWREKRTQEAANKAQRQPGHKLPDWMIRQFEEEARQRRFRECSHPRPRASAEWREILNWCLRYTSVLDGWQTRFLIELGAFAAPSEKQMTKLQEIAEMIARTEAMRA